MDAVTNIDQYLEPYRSRTYPAGQTILYAHDTPANVFYIQSGRVAMFDFTPKGNEIVLNSYEPQRFFPLGWAFNGTPVKFFFRAEVTTVVRLIPREQAVALVTGTPAIATDLLQNIYHKTDRVFDRMVQLMSASASRRLLYELLAEYRQFGNTNQDGSCLLNLKEIDLASRTGLSRETISREIHKLKVRHIVEVQRQGILVQDVDELERLFEKSI